MSQVNRIKKEFRSDINGLRAWAVAAVILYHFGVPILSGGFVGVDVFFVISGFLMTGIVISDLERGQFSVSAFYAARGRRIVPALAALCLVLFGVGYFFLLPEDYDNLSVHSAFSLLFLSNIRYGRESGYFDQASTEKWLLHTWSLSVEWQFYLLLPLILLFLWRLMPGRKTLQVIVAVAIVASLGCSVWLTFTRASDAFFLLPSRAWELLAGGGVYILASRGGVHPRHSKALELVGLTLIVASAMFFSRTDAWPGWLALVPVIGASAVIFAARSESRWTGHVFVQWAGTRSYSLYLWHWPIVVALSYFDIIGRPMATIIGLVLTLILGETSFRFIEEPARKRLSHLNPRKMAYVALALIVAVIFPAAIIHARDGLPDRFSSAVQATAGEALNKRTRRDECLTMWGDRSPGCRYGGEKLRAVLIGDSHADTVVTSLSAAAPDSEAGVLDWSYASCPTLFGVKYVVARPDVQCDQFLKWALSQLSTLDRNVPLVVVNRFTAYAYGHNEAWEGDVNVPGVYFTRK